MFTANGPKVHIVPDQGPAPPVAFLAFAQLQKSQASHLLSKKRARLESTGVTAFKSPPVYTSRTRYPNTQWKSKRMLD